MDLLAQGLKLAPVLGVLLFQIAVLLGELLPYLMWDQEPPSCRHIAQQIGTSEIATRILIHRLRVKFRTLLKEEVARTVLTPEEIPGELAWLQGVLAGK